MLIKIKIHLSKKYIPNYYYCPCVLGIIIPNNYYPNNLKYIYNF